MKISTVTRMETIYDLSVEGNHNFCALEDNGLVHNIFPCEKAVQVLAKALPVSCKKVGICKDFALKLEAVMLRKELKGKRICVKNSDKRRSFIYSTKHGLISDHGDRVATQVGDMVFDNLYPEGIPLSEWVDDLGLNEGHPSLSSWTEQLGSSGCL